MASTKDSSGRIILVIVGLLVLAALGYFSAKYYAERQTNKEKGVEIEELNNEIVDLEENIRELETTIEDKDLEIAEKDQLLDEKFKELETMVSRINKLKGSGSASQAKIKSLEDKVTELRGTVDAYRAQVSQLQAKTEVLTAKLDSVTNSEDKLKEQNTALLEINEEKDQKIQLGKSLNAASFRFFKIRKNEKEIEDTEFKRLGLNEMKICFTIMENLLAAPGQKTVYVVIENPLGFVLTNMADNYSGSFTFEGGGKAYSARVEVTYDRSSTPVCLFYANAEGKENKFEKGEYVVSVYTSDERLGAGTFSVK